MVSLPHALVVDDEESIRGFLSEVLNSSHWDVRQAASADEAFSQLDNSKFDLVFCDVMLGGTDGYTVLRQFVEKQPDVKFILMTGHGSAAGALDATSIGAFDYLVKPFSISDVVRIANLVREQKNARSCFIAKENDDAPRSYVSDIPLIGKSPKFVNCLKLVGRVAATTLPVLITGESGTGKEIVANAIHQRSHRASGPFVTINCGAIPFELIESELFGHAKGSFTGASSERTGMWEEASGGTLFLDEITETNSLFQVKLLRALQENEIRRVGSNKSIKVDSRIIAATNRDIEAEVEAGRFRQDLMYRLNAVTIDLPPLRERLEDIPALTSHFAQQVTGRNIRFADQTLESMRAYAWPGNIRELENAVLHAVSISEDVVHPEHLPDRILSGVKDNSPDVFDLVRDPSETLTSAAQNGDLPTLAEVQSRYAAKVLDHTGGNKQAAARILNIDRKTLGRILDKGDQ